MLPRDLLDIGKVRAVEERFNKEKKQKCMVIRIKKEKSNSQNLDWEKLESNFCPKCGFSLNDRGDFFTCSHDDFKISRKKLIEIQRELAEKREMNYPHGLYKD
jgi:tRNA(Ile2) C34 agmatinyltransferase TiaS